MSEDYHCRRVVVGVAHYEAPSQRGHTPVKPDVEHTDLAR